MRADIVVIRAVFTVILVTAGYLIRPIPALGPQMVTLGAGNFGGCRASYRVGHNLL
jgi:hypothetical protein